MKKSGVKFLVASMGRRPGLSINDANIALRLLEAVLHAANVARQFGCHERTKYRMQARFRQTRSVNHRPNPERAVLNNALQPLQSLFNALDKPRRQDYLFVPPDTS
jgi:hypothetical protein